MDRKLIAALDDEPRASLTTLGKTVGLSGDAVRERLRRMAEERVLRVTASVDPEALGYHAFALIGIRVRGSVAPVAAAVGAIPKGGFAACTTGSFDLLAEIAAADDAELLSLLDREVRPLDGVRDVTVFSYLRVDKWLADGLRALGTPAGARRARVTDADLRLIRALRADGRASYAELSIATGLPYGMARRRLRALTRDGTVRVVARVDRKVAGIAVWAAVALRTGGAAAPVVKALAAMPEVHIVVTTAGFFDLWLEVTCGGRARLAELVSEHIRAVPGVESIETFAYLAMAKLPEAWSPVEPLPA